MEPTVETFASIGPVLSVGKMRPISGYAYGLRSPSLLVSLLRGEAVSGEYLATVGRTLDDALRQVGVSSAGGPEPKTSKDAVESVLFWLEQFQEAAGLPLMESGRVVFERSDRQVLIAVPMPGGAHQPIARLLQWLVNLCNEACMGNSLDARIETLPRLLSELKPWAAKGSNVPRLLRAARTLGIQTDVVVGKILQFGQGRHARWLDSSFTDETPHIAAALARNKFATAAILHKAGIPVPRHLLVGSEDDAVAAAEQLRYPVVVKPAQLDGGLGVAAGLRSPEEVRSAYAAARKHSNQILVEKHVTGRDYRLNILHGEVLWAIERVPAGVVGDGISTVRSLVQQINADPQRGSGRYAAMKRLDLDDEAAAALAGAGMSADTVPAEGEFVPLRRKANIAAGGTPVAVMDKVHPDNARLAVRAAAALRLDLAGIDLLMPDISQSWKETGAAVCEVNAQPQLGGVTSLHVYPQILNALIHGTGRIPIVTILGAAKDSDLADVVSDALTARGLAVGSADRRGVRVAGEDIIDEPMTSHAAGRLLMGDRTVDAAVLCVNDSSLWSKGLPFDRFDVLILAGPHLYAPSDMTRLSRESMFTETLALILPACDGTVLTLKGAGMSITNLENRTNAQWDPTEISHGKVADRVIFAIGSRYTLSHHDRAPS